MEKHNIETTVRGLNSIGLEIPEEIATLVIGAYKIVSDKGMGATLEDFDKLREDVAIQFEEDDTAISE